MCVDLVCSVRRFVRHHESTGIRELRVPKSERSRV